MVRVTGNDSLAKRTGAKLILDETLLPMIGGVRLRMTLDKHLWAERDHVTVGELCEWFPRYLYLPRVKGRDTILEAVKDGASLLMPEDAFATAEGYDEDKGRYLGLRVGHGVPSAIDNQTCLVKVPLARKQMEEDAKSAGKPLEPGTGNGGTITGPTGGTGAVAEPGAGTPPPTVSTKPTAFVGSVKLSGARVGRDAGRIADEVIAHLAALPGAKVDVTLEVQVKVGEGVEEDVVRTVSENATALKFDHASFEKD